MNIPNKNFKFFYKNGNYFCSVKLPIDTHPTVYMNMGHDNRPFTTIAEDIVTAFNMLLDNYQGNMFIRDIEIALDLPELLGYKRATSAL